jgi:hypothetical protein
VLAEDYEPSTQQNCCHHTPLRLLAISQAAPLPPPRRVKGQSTQEGALQSPRVIFTVMLLSLGPNPPSVPLLLGAVHPDAFKSPLITEQ